MSVNEAKARYVTENKPQECKMKPEEDRYLFAAKLQKIINAIKRYLRT